MIICFTLRYKTHHTHKESTCAESKDVNVLLFNQYKRYIVSQILKLNCVKTARFNANTIGSAAESLQHKSSVEREQVMEFMCV